MARTKAELEALVAELSAKLAANPNAAKASVEPGALVTRKGLRAQVLDIKYSEAYKRVSFKINRKVTLRQAERNAAGFVVADSEVAIRETNWIECNIRDMRMNTTALGLTKLVLIDGYISREVLSAMLNAWITFDIIAYHAGDDFTDEDGNVLQHEHDGANVVLVRAQLNRDDVMDAYDMISRKRAKK